ncbi:hypothetical protein BKA70DRAFT_1445964 [Coprinopsis sp. MPI-PUGE-AT-0042]|nr:hypothetical protein BKA70DRAFT_1445964 [Coprinopsis sp. MPI-PUGE-AT-0042]
MTPSAPWMKEPPPPTKEPEPAATINRVDSITSDVAQEPRDAHSTPLNPEVKLAEERLRHPRRGPSDEGATGNAGETWWLEENAPLQSLNQITQLVVLQDIDTRCGQENQLRPMAWGHVSFSIDNKMGSGATKLAIRAQVWVRPRMLCLKKTKPELAIVLKGQDKKGDPSGNLGETDVVSDFEILKMELVMLDTARDMVDWVKKAEEKHYQQLEGIAAIPSNETTRR